MSRTLIEEFVDKGVVYICLKIHGMIKNTIITLKSTDKTVSKRVDKK